MTAFDDEIEIRRLLAPLQKVEPVTLSGRKPKRRQTIVAGLVAVVLVATGVAVAAGLNPFAGIRAADHSQTPQDIIDPAVLARIQAHQQKAYSSGSRLLSRLGMILPTTSRLVGQATSGIRIYVATTTTNDLCVILIHAHNGRLRASVAYTAPLTEAHPTTLESFVDQAQTPPITFGVAQNGITSVSFRAHGKQQTVPVTHNVWFYEGQSNILNSITLHYANGTSKTLIHGRLQPRHR